MGLRAFTLDALPDEPWRNGGGRTRTIATQMRDVRALDADTGNETPWDWRISVATIERSGPFSAFPGVDRSSMLLGAGRIELRAAGETTLCMQRPGQVVAYRGDTDWTATVHRDGPPLSLLNVMTRRGAFRARMHACRSDFFLGAPSMAVLVIEGRWRVVDASAGPDSDRRWTLTSADGVLSDGSSLPATLPWRFERLSQSGMLAAIEIDHFAPR